MPEPATTAPTVDAFYVSAGADRALSEAARTGRDIVIAGAHYRKTNHGGPAAHVSDSNTERTAVEVPHVVTLTTESAALSLLYGLNESGDIPEVTALDSVNRPVVLWLNESGGDDVLPRCVLLTGEDAAYSEPVETPLADLSYPLTAFVRGTADGAVPEVVDCLMCDGGRDLAPGWLCSGCTRVGGVPTAEEKTDA